MHCNQTVENLSETISKTSRQKNHITYKRTVKADFLSEILEARNQEMTFFKENFQFRILYPVKYLSKNKVKCRHFNLSES